MDCSSSITRRLFLFLTGGLLAKLGYASAVAEESKEKALSATDIMQRLAEAYKSCKSYQDSGTVTTVFHHKDGKQNTSLKPFTTAFVRPDGFRFRRRDSARRDAGRGPHPLHLARRWQDATGDAAGAHGPRRQNDGRGPQSQSGVGGRLRRADFLETLSD